jgi:hypothetical protein
METLSWNMDPTKGLVLRLLTDEESTLSVSVARPLSSIAVTPTASTASSSKTHTAIVPRARGQQFTKEQLIKELQIPNHLTDRCDADLHLAYQRWKANQSALNLLAERVANGTWPGARPTEQQVYECFISKSTWFLYYRKNFLNIAEYPDMVLWLDKDPSAPSNFDLWGFEKATYHFKDLVQYLECVGGKGTKKPVAERSAIKKRKQRKEKEAAEDGKAKTHKKAKMGKAKGNDKHLS